MNHKKRIIMILFFLLGIGIAAGANILRNVNDEESGTFSFQIQEDGQQVVIIDVAKQGTVKYYLQPGTLTLYGRGKNTSPSMEISAKFDGIKAFLSQGSKKSSWTELTEDMLVKTRKNGIIPIIVEVEFLYNKTRQYEIGKGTLEFWHDKQLVHSIQFQFINSNYGQP